MRDQDVFWAGVAESKLLIQKCADCGTLRYPPGPSCSACESLSWMSHEVVGRGTLCGWIVSKHPTQLDRNARIVALIELEEGPRLISNIQGADLSDLDLGMPVELFFARVNDMVLPQFRPVAGR